jgi:hypothetical protein
MTTTALPRSGRDADTYPIIVAIVQALLADTRITGNTAANGYEGVGQRVYPEANIASENPGTTDDFPYLIVTAPANAAPFDYTGAYLDGIFDITVVDRAHTPTNRSGGTQNVVPVTAAAQNRLLNNPLTVTGMSGVTVAPESAARGTAQVQQGVVYRQRQFTVRVKATKT